MSKEHKKFLKEFPDFARIADKHGEYICGAPWTSFSFESDGEIAFCCIANDNIRDIRQGATSLDEIINSPRAKAVRADLLKGNKPKYCNTCWQSEEMYKMPSQNRVSNTEWAGVVIDDLIANTDANGYMHKQAPTWFDIMFSNKCNFACMGCYTHLSTTIGKYAEAFDIRDRFGDDLRPLRQALSEKETLISNVDTDAIINHIIQHKDTVTHIHLVGGEPFMMPEVYKTLDKLIQHDLHKPGGINIWCHTNGSIRTYKGEDIIKKYLSKWEDRFIITMSHDGCGPRGEYIRYGYRDKKWLETYNRFIEAGCRVNIQHCLNIFNILHQPECLNWYINNLSGRRNFAGGFFDLFFTPWDGLFSFSHIKHIPVLYNRVIRQIEECIDICNKHLSEENRAVNEYEKLLLRVKNIVPEDESIDYMHLNFVKAINKFDEMRNTDFHKIFPELKPFWDFCNV